MRWRGTMWRAFKSLLRIYLVVAILLALLQKKLIFIGTSTQGKPESQASPAATGFTGEKPSDPFRSSFRFVSAFPRDAGGSTGW